MLALANLAMSQAGCVAVAESSNCDVIVEALASYPGDGSLQQAGCFLVRPDFAAGLPNGQSREWPT